LIDVNCGEIYGGNVKLENIDCGSRFYNIDRVAID
jgi:hypothetical protein